MGKGKSGIKLNIEGFRELRTSPEAHQALVDLARQVQKDASNDGDVDGYVVTDLVLEDPRAAVSVMATGHAARHNRKHHALVSALIRTKR